MRLGGLGYLDLNPHSHPLLAQSSLLTLTPRTFSPLDIVELEATVASPRKKKKKNRPQESRQEVEENEHPDTCPSKRQRGSAIPGSPPPPAVNGRRPGDRAGTRLRGTREPGAGAA